MLNSIKRLLHRHFLRKELQDLQIQRVTTNLSDARDVGIVFKISDGEINKQVYDFANRLKTPDRRVILLGYLDAKQTMLNYTFPYFNKSELNWYLEPVSRIALDFIERPFDIMISLCNQECLPIEYICALSHAKFRIGAYNPEKTYCYDMMLHVPASPGLDGFIKEVNYYLQRI